MTLYLSCFKTLFQVIVVYERTAFYQGHYIINKHPFEMVLEYHDYLTRSRFNLHKTNHKYQFAITWQAPVIWNDIPLTVRNSLTLSNFKKKLRLHFLNAELVY